MPAPTTAVPSADDLAGRFSRAATLVTAPHGRCIAAHYGSVAAEMAVCAKKVGLAFRTDLSLLEVRGRDAWLERLLARGLAGRVPRAGFAAVLAETWCCCPEERTALIVGRPGAVERWHRLAREALIAGSPITSHDVTAAHVPLSLIGPKARRLLAEAGLPHDLPAEGVGAGRLEGARALVLREGPDRYLLLLAADSATPACQALLDAGRSVGLSLVGAEAVARLAAAARPHVA